mmetsp:Transcript_14074/g.30546  ORF Transcript_14074/g.30546 Transcript_14074/m.30546 type:complete len:486 (+) Transcript_14074:751-2208(+)
MHVVGREEMHKAWRRNGRNGNSCTRMSCFDNPANGPGALAMTKSRTATTRGRKRFMVLLVGAIGNLTASRGGDIFKDGLEICVTTSEFRAGRHASRSHRLTDCRVCVLQANRSSSDGPIIFNIICNELEVVDVALVDDVVVRVTLSNVVHLYVADHRPKVRNGLVGASAAAHVARGDSAVLLGHVPVLEPHAVAAQPVRKRSDVPRDVESLGGAKEGVGLDAPVQPLSDARYKLCLWDNPSTDDHEVAWHLVSVVQNHARHLPVLAFERNHGALQAEVEAESVHKAFHDGGAHDLAQNSFERHGLHANHRHRFDLVLLLEAAGDLHADEGGADDDGGLGGAAGVADLNRVAGVTQHKDVAQIGTADVGEARACARGDEGAVVVQRAAVTETNLVLVGVDGDYIPPKEKFNISVLPKLGIAKASLLGSDASVLAEAGPIVGGDLLARNDEHAAFKARGPQGLRGCHGRRTPSNDDERSSIICQVAS